jgi:hypothetical protein
VYTVQMYITLMVWLYIYMVHLSIFIIWASWVSFFCERYHKFYGWLQVECIVHKYEYMVLKKIEGTFPHRGCKDTKDVPGCLNLVELWPSAFNGSRFDFFGRRRKPSYGLSFSRCLVSCSKDVMYIWVDI